MDDFDFDIKLALVCLYINITLMDIFYYFLSLKDLDLIRNQFEKIEMLNMYSNSLNISIGSDAHPQNKLAFSLLAFFNIFRKSKNKF